jgi:hypothetical protein
MQAAGWPAPRKQMTGPVNKPRRLQIWNLMGTFDDVLQYFTS